MTSPLTTVDPVLAREKEARLSQQLQALGRVYVAFSGGVDSTYLLALAVAQLGQEAIAVTAISPSLAARSLTEAKRFCRDRGIRHDLVETDEFDHEAYRRNDGMRCYECKAALFRAMQAVRFQAGADGAMLVGALAEDFSDHRPGLVAAREAGAKWPLADAGLNKAEVRYLSKQRDLPTWDRPAEPCLASRVPYGQRVDEQGLRMIEAAEDILSDAGFRINRARHHDIGGGRGYLCRIEVPEEDLAAVLAARTHLLPAIRDCGYAQVSIDLAGLRSGGLNDLLSADERDRLRLAAGTHVGEAPS